MFDFEVPCLNANGFLPFRKLFSISFLYLNVVVVVYIWVSLLINSDDLNSALNQRKINVWLQWGQMKLYG